MSILKNNWHWMLLAFTIFGGIGVVLFTQLNTDTEPKIVYNPPSEEILQNIREKSSAQKTQEVSVPIDHSPTPPRKSFEDSDVWHDQPQTEVNKEEQPFSALTSSELNALYQQIVQDLSLMNSDEELDRGPDLSKYSTKQRIHLLTVGIDLSLLPPQLQDKITNYQWRAERQKLPLTVLCQFYTLG